MENYRDIIKGPIMTEKSSNLASNNVITLSVDVKANKTLSMLDQRKKELENTQDILIKLKKQLLN